jgi:hypothetical protein
LNPSNETYQFATESPADSEEAPAPGHCAKKS